MSKTDKRVSQLNKTSQLKEAEARVKALSNRRKSTFARRRRGKGFLLNHLIKQDCFGPRKKIPPILYKLPVARHKTTRQKRGKGWGNLAALGLGTAAKGLWEISSAGKQKRYRDQEALNKIQQDYYANHYHR